MIEVTFNDAHAVGLVGVVAPEVGTGELALAHVAHGEVEAVDLGGGVSGGGGVCRGGGVCGGEGRGVGRSGGRERLEGGLRSL